MWQIHLLIQVWHIHFSCDKLCFFSVVGAVISPWPPFLLTSSSISCEWTWRGLCVDSACCVLVSSGPGRLWSSSAAPSILAPSEGPADGTLLLLRSERDSRFNGPRGPGEYTYRIRFLSGLWLYFTLRVFYLQLFKHPLTLAILQKLYSKHE